MRAMGRWQLCTLQTQVCFNWQSMYNMVATAAVSSSAASVNCPLSVTTHNREIASAQLIATTTISSRRGSDSGACKCAGPTAPRQRKHVSGNWSISQSTRLQYIIPAVLYISTLVGPKEWQPYQSIMAILTSADSSKGRVQVLIPALDLLWTIHSTHCSNGCCVQDTFTINDTFTSAAVVATVRRQL